MYRPIRFVNILGVLLLSLVVEAQTIVSTTPENKNVVLEAFNGIYNTYDSDAHVISQGIQDAFSGDVIIINVHQGGYAVPNFGDPDYRTAFGDTLANQSGLCGYPAGTVNRQEFSGLAQTGTSCVATTALERGNWSNASTQVLAQPAPVNVAATCSLDVVTKVMTFFAEVYYTANSDTSSNRLTIAVSENKVKGPQTGASTFNPGNIDSDGLYSHNHMLRSFITGQWGANISPTTAGSFYSNTFTYATPLSYNGILPNIGNFEVSVFVSEGQEKILNAAQVPIVYTNIPTTNNAAVASVQDLGAACETTVSPIVTVQNLGGANLTSLDITYDINGGASNTYGWTGNLGYYATQDVSLPAIGFIGQGTNTINVAFSNPNGSTDEDLSDNSDTASFTDPPLASNVVELSLLLDEYCSETTWKLKNSSGTVLYSGGPYNCNPSGGGAQANTTITETFNLPLTDCYDFIIYDSYGDGLNGAVWGGANGSYSLSSDSIVFASGGDSIQFFEESNPFSVLCVGANLSSSSTPASCGLGNGTGTVYAFGGTMPYTFLWNDSSAQTTATATGLQGGVYYAGVTDATGCTATIQVIVTTLAGPVVSTVGTDPSSCGATDGSVTATVIVGTPPLTYSWSSGGSTLTESNLGAGTYTITVTDSSGCVDTSSSALTTPGTPVATASGSDPSSCGLMDGAATVSISGGTNPFSYQWDDPAMQSSQTATGLGDGTYKVIITDGAGCMDSASTTLSSGSPPIVTLIGTDPSGCISLDGSALGNTIGGSPPYAYQWDDANAQTTLTATGLGGGTYTLVVTDIAGCQTTEQITLNTGIPPVVTTSGSNPTSCGSSDGTVTASTSGGTPPFTYAWSSGGNSVTESNLDAGTYAVTVTDSSGCVDSSSTILSNVGAPSLNATVTDASCSSDDGMVSVLAIGGTGPFTFDWSNGGAAPVISNLTAGTYSVTLTDALGCIAITTVTVGSTGNGPDLTFVSTDLNCYGNSTGSAQVSASGGDEPYTFLWSTGGTSTIISAKPAGVYEVTVWNSKGCQTTQSVIISGPSEIVTLSTVSNANCGVSDGIASLNSTGGVPPYSYQWDAAAGNQTSATANGLSAGTYSVTTTDGNGCPVAFQINVSNIGAPSVTLTPSDAPCFNEASGSASSIAGGGSPPYDYSWSDGSSGANLLNVTAGTYTLTLTDAVGCILVQSVVIGEAPELIGDISYINVSNDSTCDGSASIVASGGTGSYQYVWDDSLAQTGTILTGLCLGTYTVTITDANGCNISVSIYVDSIPMGINVPEVIHPISVYPNPSTGMVNISWDMPSEEVVMVRIFGLEGKAIHTSTIRQNSAYIHTVDLATYPKGLYFVQVVTSNQVIVSKLVLH